VIRYGTTLPKRIAGNSEISPQNPIIHRAIPILQLAHWVYSDFDIRAITITYRHSRQLNELAHSIAQLSSPDTPEAQLPPRTDNDGFKPILATGMTDHAAIGAWLSARIEEIERLSQELPPIAVLVSYEDEAIPLADYLNGVLR
jgi:hypothetical protein